MPRTLSLLLVVLALSFGGISLGGAPGIASPSVAFAPVADTGALAFAGARILDGTGGAVIEDGVILVRDGVIVDVGRRGQVIVPIGTDIVEFQGRWLVPGLVNAHGHVSGDEANVLRQLRQYAHYGVTTVVSLGGNEAAAFPLRDAQESPHLNHARVYLAGAVITPGTAEEARSEVARVAEMGADWVKIRVDGGLQGGARMPPEVYGAVIAEARARELPVAIHIWELDAAKGVVEAGGALVAHSVRDLPVDGALIDLMRDRGVCLVPTLTRELSTFVYAERPDFFDDPFFLQGAAPADLSAFLTPNLMASQAESTAGRFWREALPLAQQNMRRMLDGGVGIAMGTDSGAPTGRWEGYFEHVELAMMVEGGLTPEEALFAAGGGAARCLGLEGVVGTIEEGARADFLVLNEDPRADILHTREIHSVWIAGNRIR